ncbi:patatin-like protein 6 [Dorcoceras hygrometricum]|uniref:Patatin n=1 Tax=Dorcoceras hygrometricum TaxID=472368 RepID=A0A2Z7B1U3_9LAMI|nr:patatin-like protein 6 [Dorcoceras hygrometricum]
MEESSIHTDRLCYEIFSILESKFLFGYDDQKLWVEENGVAAESDGVLKMKNQRGKVCILSIDGNGMRSVVSGKALWWLESALKDKSGNPDARIADYFDVAAGAGVGGILTAMLFASSDQDRPIFHAGDTWKFLSPVGTKLYLPAKSRSSGGGFLKRIFKKTGGSKLYASGLDKPMKESFTDVKTGRVLTLKDTLKPVLIPCYDLSTAAPFLFSRADALETDSYNFNLWEVCLATSAEPGFSNPVCMRSVDGLTRCIGVDGGLVMSNPTAAAITHVLHNKQEFPFVRGVEDILVLSLGAGGQLVEGSFDYDKVRKWTPEDWVRPLSRISGKSAAELVDQAVAAAFGPSRSSNYVRIQLANGSTFSHCGANIDSDPSTSNVNTLLGIGEEMLKQKNVESILFGGERIGEQSNFEKLDWFADQLVLEHQRRSCRIAPTVAFKQAASKYP